MIEQDIYMFISHATVYIHVCIYVIVHGMVYMYLELHNPLLLQVVGEVAGMDHGVYGVAHHEEKLAVVAGTTLYMVTVNPKLQAAAKEP